MTKALFFDSYAVIEILRKNPAYASYLDYYPILIKLNLFEVYYILKRDELIEEAEWVLKKYESMTIDFSTETIRQAAGLKLKNKKLSMTDCIGYALSREFGVKFLTGDQEFKELENVEYVK